MLQQRGDVVLEIRISKPSRVTRQRHTIRSALGLGVSAAFLGLGIWLDRGGDDDLSQAASVVASLLGQLIAGRWMIEESRPLPRNNHETLTYRALRAADFTQRALVFAATFWIGFLGPDGPLWLAFATIVPGAFASALVIEHFYQRLFDRIGERTAGGRGADNG